MFQIEGVLREKIMTYGIEDKVEVVTIGNGKELKTSVSGGTRREDAGVEGRTGST